MHCAGPNLKGSSKNDVIQFATKLQLRKVDVGENGMADRHLHLPHRTVH